MLTKQSREDLKWAMKASLLEQAGQIQEKEARQFVKEFVLNEATYEQLLNLTYNPYRDDVYLESEKLETVAKTFIEESLEGKSGKKAITILESYINEKIGDYLKRQNSEDPTWGGQQKNIDLAQKKADWADKLSSGGNKTHAGMPAPVSPETAKSAIETMAGGQEGGTERGKMAGLLARSKGALSAAGRNISKHKLGYGAAAAGVAAAGIGGYLIYRKMRAAGKDKRQAALAAANASKDPAEQQKWMSKAQIA